MPLQKSPEALLPIPAQAPSPTPQAPVAMCNIAGGVVNVRATYGALETQRDILRQQLNTQTSLRRGIAERLRSNTAPGPDRAGLEQRITELDKTIAQIEADIAANDRQLACIAGQPGAVPPFVPGPRPSSDDELALAGVVLSFFLALPLVIAWSRRVWRRGAQVTQIPRELNDRLTRLEHSVDSVAIELERVGEGQRFVTNLFAQNGMPKALGAGAMDSIEIEQRERVAQERRDR